MIEILTLFVGLYVGPQAIELEVDPEVRAVELRLDDKPAGRLEGEPWATEVDFGESLSPHRLEAIAFDSRGREAARSERWINYSRGTYGARLELLGDEPGQPEALGVRWESLGHRRPQRLEVRFDGQRLPVADPFRIELPAYDPQLLHLVEADLHFSAQDVTRIETTFGGVLGERLEAELTAVVVELEGSTRGFAREASERLWLGGERARIHGTEKGLAEAVFVIDPALEPWLQALEERVGERNLAEVASLGPQGRLRLLGARAAPLTGDHLTAEMFRSSPAREAPNGLLMSYLEAEIPELPVHLADSVALAGLEAQASNRRRAVVLLLGEPRPDGSLFTPEAVRAFLRRLHVPLYVWSTVGDNTHPDWGPTLHLAVEPDARPDPGPLKAAMRDLRRTLDDQRIVWLEGQHLPQAVSLRKGEMEMALAGSGN